MAEFQVNGITYQSGKMNAMTQFHVSRRLAPLLASFTEIAKTGAADTAPGAVDVPKLIASLMGEISKLSDADCEYVLNACMVVTTRDQGGGRGFARLLAPDNKTAMFPDIDMLAMLTIAAAVLQDNLAGFFPSNVLASGGVGTDQASNG